MKALLLLLAVIVGLAAGFGLERPSRAPLRHVIPQPRDAFSNRNSPVVFEGVVLERLESPMRWCGISASFQGVRYRVEAVNSGPISLSEQVIFHVLAGPPLCEKELPVLSKSIFRKGRKLIVRAEMTPAGDYVGWEHAGDVQVLK